MPDLPQGSYTPFFVPQNDPPLTAAQNATPDLPVGSPAPYSPVMTMTPSQPNPPGLVERGNIDLQTRPRTHNPDGSTSSVFSGSFEDPDTGVQVLVPYVSDGGKILTDREAQQQYAATGKHLGKFKTPQHADDYSEALHQDYAQGKIAGYPAVGSGTDAGFYPNKTGALDDLNAVHSGISQGFKMNIPGHN